MKYSFKKSFMFVLTILALTFSLVGVTPAYAAILTVTNTADSGAGSLRDTIASAGIGDTITFDIPLSGGIIYLASTLTLTQDVTIDGSALASKITISGDTDNNGTGNVQVFSVNTGVTATLNSLIITKGAITGFFGSGGGINNAGTLIVTNSTLSGNSATFIGGGINNSSGTLIVTNSTLSDNQGGFGGGIHNAYGTLTVTNSTLSGNSSYSGGGIYDVVGTLTVTNSTLSNNSATNNGGGIYNSSSALTVTNSTLSGNSAAVAGGGIYNNFGTLSYANTIIANSSGGDCVNSGGTIGTNTSNLVEDNSCSSSLSGDPSLGALASNDGPTQTFALLADSPAIDAGNDPTCAALPVNNLDQRGAIRPQGAQCDIGSYEALTVSMSSIATNPTNGSPIAVTVTFNGSVTGFDSSDIIPGNGAISAFAAITGTTYTFDLTPAAQGLVTADIAADVAQNGSVGNIAAAQFSRTYDIIPPTVSMSSPATDPTNASPIAVTVTFNESVTGFTSSDIIPGNGAVSAFAAVTGTTYTFDLTPAGQGLVFANIAADVATDLAGNGNTIANQFSRTYATVYKLFLPLLLR